MQNKKHILFIGLNGKLGQKIVPIAIKEYFIHCMINTAPQLALNSIFFKIIDGNATNPDQLMQALENKYAVISAFEVSENDSQTAIQQYTKTLINAMNQKGVKRLIVVGSSGSLKYGNDYFYQNNQYPQNLRKRSQDHTKAKELLQKCQLCYTIVCPHNVTNNEQQKEVKVSYQGKSSQISSANLGKFLVSLVQNSEYNKKVIGVHEQI